MMYSEFCIYIASRNQIQWSIGRAMSTAESAHTHSSSSCTTAVQAIHWAMGVSVLGTLAFMNMTQQTTDEKKKMVYIFIHKSTINNHHYHYHYHYHYHH
jgi:hypothetical protein